MLLADAVANFECRVVSELATGDHVIFVGEVVCSHVHDPPLNRLYTVAEGFAMGGLARAPAAGAPRCRRPPARPAKGRTHRAR